MLSLQAEVLAVVGPGLRHCNQRHRTDMYVEQYADDVCCLLEAIGGKWRRPLAGRVQLTTLPLDRPSIFDVVARMHAPHFSPTCTCNPTWWCRSAVGLVLLAHLFQLGHARVQQCSITICDRLTTSLVPNIHPRTAHEHPHQVKAASRSLRRIGSKKAIADLAVYCGLRQRHDPRFEHATMR